MRTDQINAPSPQTLAKGVGVRRLVINETFGLLSSRPRRGADTRASVRSIRFTSAADADSSSSLCPSWWRRHKVPFFGRGKTAVGKGFGPVKLSLAIKLYQKGAPCRQPDILLLPSAQTTPIGAGRGLGRGQVFAAHAAVKDLQDTLETGAIGEIGLGPPQGEARGSGRKGSIFPPAHRLIHSDRKLSYETASTTHCPAVSLSVNVRITSARLIAFPKYLPSAFFDMADSSFLVRNLCTMKCPNEQYESRRILRFGMYLPLLWFNPSRTVLWLDARHPLG